MGGKDGERVSSLAELLSESRGMENCIVTSLPLPREWYDHPKLCIAIEQLLTAEECTALIEHTESKGYDRALLNIGGGKEILATEVRNSDRCIIDDEGITRLIWGRIRAALKESKIPHLWAKFETAVGLNERLRFLRYDPGGYFAPHYDGHFTYQSTEHPWYGLSTYVTCQIYLNEGFEGGGTTFLDPSFEANEGVTWTPKTGSVLLFEHAMVHAGDLLVKGRKYAVRTDVVYGEM